MIGKIKNVSNHQPASVHLLESDKMISQIQPDGMDWNRIKTVFRHSIQSFFLVFDIGWNLNMEIDRIDRMN